MRYRDEFATSKTPRIRVMCVMTLIPYTNIAGPFSSDLGPYGSTLDEVLKSTYL